MPVQVSGAAREYAPPSSDQFAHSTLRHAQN